ncbi:uncharacterized protein TrAtP1_000743 [Trichoderma atroviride]|uniref:uncharacterized protein n=1 Tax=Hypocrea atroviridis TaxID=63577 RepID=UPI00332E9D30|nr:hypothetical protein TrAtP1_000743 [Trichoderma atroviride]
MDLSGDRAPEQDVFAALRYCGQVSELSKMREISRPSPYLPLGTGVATCLLLVVSFFGLLDSHLAEFAAFSITTVRSLDTDT